MHKVFILLLSFLIVCCFSSVFAQSEAKKQAAENEAEKNVIKAEGKKIDKMPRVVIRNNTQVNTKSKLKTSQSQGLNTKSDADIKLEEGEKQQQKQHVYHNYYKKKKNQVNTKTIQAKTVQVKKKD